jgi:transcriptional regulator with XRE-family HTH domain
MIDEQGFLARSAATFRGMLNDLKRDEASAADELGVDLSLVVDILAARRPITSELIRRAVALWPVNERDFFPIHDDAPSGVRVMREADSAASSRIIERAGSAYYEYRDTAMSRIAAIRPEWIKILNMVSNDDPDCALVRWNNGHFLYQFTYFIGPVNYYYSWDGRRHCARMNTGDSVFGLPYAPHSFSTRAPSEPGLILALTFGGRLLGDAQHELGVLSEDAVGKITRCGMHDTARSSFVRIEAAMTERNCPLERMAEKSGLPRSRLESFIEGRETPDIGELGRMAEVLRVSPRDLMPWIDDTQDGVRIVRAAEAAAWNFPEGNSPSYHFRELACSTAASFAGAFEVTPLRSIVDDHAAEIDIGMHQFIYVVGDTPAVVYWRDGDHEQSELIEQGDSIYIKPYVSHRFRAALPGGGPDDCKLLVLRVGGRLTGDAACEAAILGSSGIKRLRHDLRRWYER